MRWSASERHFATGKNHIFVISGNPGDWDIFYHDNGSERVGEQRFFAHAKSLDEAKTACEEMDEVPLEYNP
jgi:hypothetical protein